MTASIVEAPASDIDPFSDEILRDPYEAHRELRDLGRSFDSKRYGVYAMARHAEVHAALIDWQTYCSGQGVGLAMNRQNSNPLLPRQLTLAIDPPDHTVGRAVLARVLSPGAVRRLRPIFEAEAEALAERLVEQGRFDAVADLAETYPLKVFPDAVGIAADGRENLLVWSTAIFNTFGPQNHLFQHAMQAGPPAQKWMMERCQREALSPDGMGAEIYAAADRGELQPDEAPLLVRPFLTAGIDTTVHGLGNAMRAFVSHPDQWQKLRENPTLARNAFEEALRWDSPVQTFFRTTTREVDVASVKIPANYKVLLFLGAANRDPRKWQEPDRFDIGRDTRGHVAFGTGIHGCVGQMVARLEGEAMLKALAKRIAALRLDGDWSVKPNNTLRSLARLPSLSNAQLEVGSFARVSDTSDSQRIDATNTALSACCLWAPTWQADEDPEDNMNVHEPSLASVAATGSGITPGYMSGFGNGFETEALPGALPIGRNSPQKCPYGLYAEQLSGSPFTAPRTTNERSWLYRIRPTVAHWGRFAKLDNRLWQSAPAPASDLSIQPLRWDPLPRPDENLSFVEGMYTMTTAGDVATHAGMGAHVYLATRSMQDEYFYNADGEMLVVLQQGRLRFATEFGIIDAEPGEIVVIPRGVKIRVELEDGPARGYVCENYGGAFTLPERGPIGANCLANPRDFLTPVAAYEDRDAPSKMIVKWGGSLWAADIAHSPLDVVAWHGNYAPYKYDLRRYSPVGPILFDHADPSIFTVLTSPSETPGTANVDFVLFSDRWLVAENTFRPPWYHMNVMSEFMGLVYGRYDAKPEGFVPGGASLHNCMLPHGPDVDAFEKASNAELKPHKLEGTLAFMFETRLPQRVTSFAAETPARQKGYGAYGQQLKKHFDAQIAEPRARGKS